MRESPNCLRLSRSVDALQLKSSTAQPYKHVTRICNLDIYEQGVMVTSTVLTCCYSSLSCNATVNVLKFPGCLILKHVQSHYTALCYDGLCILGVCLQKGHAAPVCYGAQCLGCLMPAHRNLPLIPQHPPAVH